jgi:hypothetical protein
LDLPSAKAPFTIIGSVKTWLLLAGASWAGPKEFSLLVLLAAGSFVLLFPQEFRAFRAKP